MWTEGAELGLGSLRGGREQIGEGICEVPGEEILRSLALVQPCCVLEAWLEKRRKPLGASQGQELLRHLCPLQGW